jgi:hypothetical protein
MSTYAASRSTTSRATGSGASVIEKWAAPGIV